MPGYWLGEQGRGEGRGVCFLLFYWTFLAHPCEPKLASVMYARQAASFPYGRVCKQDWEDWREGDGGEGVRARLCRMRRCVIETVCLIGGHPRQLAWHWAREKKKAKHSTWEIREVSG